MEQMVRQRGPDHSQWHPVHAVDGRFSMRLFSSVLHLRGQHICEQPYPVSDMDSSVLSWNGEIYAFNGQELDANQNDTQWIAEKVAGFKARQLPVEAFENLLAFDLMASIEGPFAFVYYDSTYMRIYYGRDKLGRRSLMRKQNSKHGFIISSVAFCGDPGDGWKELECGVLFSLDIGMMEVNRIRYHNVATYSQVFNRINPFGDDDPSLLEYPLQKSNGDIMISASIPITMSKEISRLLNDFNAIFRSSIKRRTTNIPGVNTDCDSAKLGILFSGGIDCTLLALLAEEFVHPDQPIDLLNASFENPRLLKTNNRTSFTADEDSKYDVPDRILGRKSLLELQQLRPGRKWNFVEINVPFTEYEQFKPEVCDLMYPCHSVMDLSISIAFWFASRGIGFISEDGIRRPYESTAKVLFSGLGADELFGGYSRHEQAFLSRNNSNDEDRYRSLINSLIFDLERLPTRNLGRDDRIISSHGKEVRFPFLDSEFINFTITQLPVHWKCDLREHVCRGIGEKVWLRMYAHHILRFRKAGVVTEKKRAIQFGAKTAKMQDGSEQGHDNIVTR